MVQELSIKEIGENVLVKLENFNRQLWDAISFRLIHTMMVEENELQSAYKKVKEYRKERWNKALAQVKGNKRKAYELISSENFV